MADLKKVTDEVIVEAIRANVNTVADLMTEAKKRGITATFSIAEVNNETDANKENVAPRFEATFTITKAL